MTGAMFNCLLKIGEDKAYASLIIKGLKVYACRGEGVQINTIMCPVQPQIWCWHKVRDQRVHQNCVYTKCLYDIVHCHVRLGLHYCSLLSAHISRTGLTGLYSWLCRVLGIMNGSSIILHEKVLLRHNMRGMCRCESHSSLIMSHNIITG